MIKITELTTSYLIPKRGNYRYYDLEKYFSALNMQSRLYEPFGLVEDEKFYRVGKIELEKLANLLNEEFEVTKISPTPYRTLKYPLKMKNPPKNKEQAEVIKHVLASYETGWDRAIISLPTGRGKTYVATNIISQLKQPALIMVKNTKLREQWFKSFHTHTVKPKVVIASGSADMMTILENKDYLYDAIICTHATARVFIENYGLKEFNRLLLQQGIGIKVFDEFDLEARSTFNIETHTNINKTLYLSATDYKSKEVDRVFQGIYGYLPNFGKEYNFNIKRIAMMLMYKSHPSSKDYYKCHKNYITDVVPTPLDYHKYHAYVIENKTYRPGMKVIWDKVISKRFYAKDRIAKTAFLIGRITTAESLRKDLANLFGISEDEIGLFNSSISAKDKAITERKKLIISNSKSLGRGIDLSNLEVLVDLETRASKSEMEQVVGRISREGASNPGIYIQFIDCSFPRIKLNYEKFNKEGLYEKQFSDVYILNLDKK